MSVARFGPDIKSVVVENDSTPIGVGDDVPPRAPAPAPAPAPAVTTRQLKRGPKPTEHKTFAGPCQCPCLCRCKYTLLSPGNGWKPIYCCREHAKGRVKNCNKCIRVCTSCSQRWKKANKDEQKDVKSNLLTDPKHCTRGPDGKCYQPEGVDYTDCKVPEGQEGWRSTGNGGAAADEDE